MGGEPTVWTYPSSAMDSLVESSEYCEIRYDRVRQPGFASPRGPASVVGYGGLSFGDGSAESASLVHNGSKPYLATKHAEAVICIT